jgi:hypothetical protein
MDKSQAIKSLSTEIESSDTGLYAFQPKDQKEKFFIGAAVITAAATVLLTAFFNGLESALKRRMQKWGDTLGTWIGDRLESLFKASATVDDDLDRRIAAVKTLIAAASAEERAQVAAEVQKVIEDTLRKHGVHQDRAPRRHLGPALARNDRCPGLATSPTTTQSGCS